MPIKTALCSFGMSGWVFHAPFIAVDPGFELYAVWERTKNTAKEKYPGVTIFRSLEEMLESKDIELVIVNTPNYTHFEYCKKCLLAEKHVIVEKPFTIHANEAQELIDLAKKQNKILSVYHNRRYDSDFRTVKKIVQKDLIGPIVEVEIHYDRYRLGLSPKVHKETPGPGTGTLYDLGSHLIDQALLLFGKPASIFADIRIIRPQSLIDDYFELLLYYHDKRVRLKSSYLVKEALPAYVLHGLKGSFIKPKTDVQEEMLQAGKIPGSSDWGVEPSSEKGLLHTEINGVELKEFIDSERGNYGDFYKGIYKAIRENAPVPVDPADAMQVVEIIEKAFESNDKKKVLDL